ncbi:hypothetical protein PDTA9759_56750 (plasmid) [Phytobacter diazotrophicus]|uniref:Uncharacterized protein n=1 Tax=Phytobacter diazotrophicus TaxID=395631 RepID=A0ABM7W320_9ENTR|nr:hypothetical protein PDTA9734_54720 [Phytobacter diazotrophicus]BEG84918.1 hypothetical protein PDTA9730_53740 [Phytobacter diazotrophicus]BEG91019.1 hypothetical protein PDTA9759_56750 [Phytobacter diazotrophicus]BEG96576.1 hypothetical protein PDTA9832_54350 [Phytobacter diazotrophicus]
MRFVIRDPKKARPGSPEHAPARGGAETQHLVLQSDASHTRCCVFALPRDPARRCRKQRCGYFLAVVHFRKVSDSVKVGSGGNGHPVI